MIFKNSTFKLKSILPIAFILNPFNIIFAQEGEVMTDEQWNNYTSELEASLEWQQGLVLINDSKVQLNLGESYRYLNPEEADKVLIQLWGNPPGSESLGMIFPSDCNPSAASCWGGILTYEDDGHIDDEDAKDIDYDDLLEEMQESTLESNKEREAQGYESVSLIGWASAPHYDENSKKLHWAKELSFNSPLDTEAENTLNYNIRVLGRTGVLNVNVVSGMSQLMSITEAIPEITELAEFTEGNTYADYNSATDNLASYGVGALIGGKVLAKVGFFKSFIALLLAAKKFLIIGAIALFGFFKKLFGQKDDQQ